MNRSINFCFRGFLLTTTFSIACEESGNGTPSEDAGAGDETTGGGEESTGEAAGSGTTSDGSEPEASTGGEPVAAPIQMFEADDPNIQYTGRIDWTDPKAPRFSAPGVYVSATFEGDSVAVHLSDEFKWGTERDLFDVILDGEFVMKLGAERDVTRYSLATGLEPGPHTIVVAKRTEASIGQTTFLGFDVGGTLLAPPPKPSLKIEFIGDSITAGAGVEAANGSPECSLNAWGEAGGWGQAFNNANMTYAAVAARALGADYHLTAVSGIGLVRNYSSQYDARTMPEVYDLMYVERMDSTPWDTAAFVPDIVVVALGTNDFSPGEVYNLGMPPQESLDVAAYTAAYIEFVNSLRGYYPDAQIVAMSSPMLGNGWPTATDTFATDLVTAVTAVETSFVGVDDKVHSFQISGISGQGCGTHPNVAQHATLGTELAEAIRGMMILPPAP